MGWVLCVFSPKKSSPPTGVFYFIRPFTTAFFSLCAIVVEEWKGLSNVGFNPGALRTGIDALTTEPVTRLTSFAVANNFPCFLWSRFRFTRENNFEANYISTIVRSLVQLRLSTAVNNRWWQRWAQWGTTPVACVSVEYKECADSYALMCLLCPLPRLACPRTWWPPRTRHKHARTFVVHRLVRSPKGARLLLGPCRSTRLSVRISVCAS